MNFNLDIDLISATSVGLKNETIEYSRNWVGDEIQRIFKEKSD